MNKIETPQAYTVVSIKSRMVGALNAILDKEASLYEADWDNMTMAEAMDEAEQILNFRKYVEKVNNIDL